MMVISVVTIAVVGAAYTFVPSFRSGTEALGDEVREILGTGQARDAGGNATAGGNTGGAGANGGGNAGDATTNGSLGNPTDPTSGGTVPGGANGPGAPNGNDTRHTRTRQSCFLGVFCFGTRETATGGGTGGDGTQTEAQKIREGDDLNQIQGAWKSFFQGDVAKTAAGASDALADKPLCGPAIVAALTGKTVDQAYQELENNGRLSLVKKETFVAGVVVKTSYETTGVMSESSLAAALRDDYGFKVTEKSGGNVGDLRAALSQNKIPIVLYDNGKGDGTSGHFGVVTDVSDFLGVKVDTATGSFWIPKGEFEKRMDVMGGKVITAQPPDAKSGRYARAP